MSNPDHPEHDDARMLARAFFQMGLRAMSRRELDEAFDLYTLSIDAFPSAEAHTCRAWVMGQRGAIDDAINECMRAIDVDPDLGNPYADLGGYLMGRGLLDEAVYYCERALDAPRYDGRQFALHRLALIHLERNEPLRARDRLRQACDVDPDYTPARQLLDALEAKLQ